jgi:hypothetical protein
LGGLEQPAANSEVGRVAPHVFSARTKGICLGVLEGLDESSPVRRGGWGMVPQWWSRPVGTIDSPLCSGSRLRAQELTVSIVLSGTHRSFSADPIRRGGRGYFHSVPPGPIHPGHGTLNTYRRSATPDLFAVAFDVVVFLIDTVAKRNHWLATLSRRRL